MSQVETLDPRPAGEEKLAISLKGKMASAFITPIVAYPWPDSEGFNAALRALILAREKETEGLRRSNVNAWHSANDLFAWEAPCIAELRRRAEAFAIALMREVAVVQNAPRTFGFRFEGWANVLRQGGYNTVHDHPNSVWSVVYYVDGGETTPDKPMSGKLEFVDPRTGANMIHLEHTLMHGRTAIDALPGLMIGFPSWLKHFVHPYFGTKERISIAFNIFTVEKR
jgi:uncharacterized protein (TIGR02466 family)